MRLFRAIAGLTVLCAAAAGPLRAAADVGGSGSYIATGRTYGVILFNSGSISWRSFSLVAPAGLTFVGGTTGNEASATCVVGPPSQIQCGPLSPSVMPPQGHLSFVATMAAPTVCGVTFELLVSSADGAPPTRTGDVTAAPDCRPTALAPPVLHGRPAVGATLRATPPTWSSPPTRVRYRWERCRGSSCAAIPGATSLALVLTRRDAGHTVRLIATATIAGETVRTASSRVTVRQQHERLRLS